MQTVMTHLASLSMCRLPDGWRYGNKKEFTKKYTRGGAPLHELSSTQILSIFILLITIVFFHLLVKMKMNLAHDSGPDIPHPSSTWHPGWASGSGPAR